MRISFHTFPSGWPYYPGSWFSYRKFHYRIDSSYALMKGMRRHGVRPFIGKKWKPSDADLAVLWSWKRPDVTAAMLGSGRHVIIMERGFIQPRNEWVSLAVDGFNNRGRFAPAPDGGKRWERLFSHHMKPWQTGGDYVLLIGQVPGDMALNGTDMVSWAQEQTNRLVKLGHRVAYRPHPELPTPCPLGATLSTGSLAGDLSGAERVVAFSSTTAVEAVLAGIPTVVCDEGSVAYPMASHSVEDPIIRPDRTIWAHDLAWRQWSLAELASGEAWAHVRQAIQ